MSCALCESGGDTARRLLMASVPVGMRMVMSRMRATPWFGESMVRMVCCFRVSRACSILFSIDADHRVAALLLLLIPGRSLDGRRSERYGRAVQWNRDGSESPMEP